MDGLVIYSPVADGKLALDPNDRALMSSWAHSVPPGKIVEISLKVSVPKKSNAQLRLFHAQVRDYAKASGHSFEAARLELKHMYGVHFDYGVEFVPVERPGAFACMYGEWEYQVSLADYSTEELSYLIDGTFTALAEVGAELSQEVASGKQT
jgi:hypothetical protein